MSVEPFIAARYAAILTDRDSLGYHPSSLPVHAAEKGTTLIEILLVGLLLGILISSATSSLLSLKNPLRDGSQQTMGFFKQVRAKAISTTSAYRVIPSSNHKISTLVGTNCSNASDPDDSFALELPLGASFTNTLWSTCFTPRGLSESNITVTVQDDESGHSKAIEVFLGGAIRETG